MINPISALSAIPSGLRTPLIEEFSDLIGSFMERKWRPSELSGGRFSEIVYTILKGHASGAYESTPNKPSDFVGACRGLEKNTHEPRSFQILIPRLLPALYEIRSNRNVGHVGGDVDPNPMDSNAVVAIASWIMAELIRVYHNLPIAEAQALVDNLSERRIPLVWKSGDIRRVLRTGLSLKDELLILIGSQAQKTKVDDLFKWVEYENHGYFVRLLRSLHKKERLVEYNETAGEIELLPPGSEYVTELLKKLG